MDSNLDGAPQWAATFLAALAASGTATAACKAASVASGTAYNLRKRHPGFRAGWDQCVKAASARRGRPGTAAGRDAGRIERFLDELAETSNVAAAAAVAGLPVSRIYRLRRTDPDFARRWYAALAEGYDNLEMELLAHLRTGESAAADKRKFDAAAALRCLTAHRESVAREKGRRSLADEAATIASINAKIDAMRERTRQSEAAIRAARKALAKPVKADGPANG